MVKNNIMFFFRNCTIKKRWAHKTQLSMMNKLPTCYQTYYYHFRMLIIYAIKQFNDSIT